MQVPRYVYDLLLFGQTAKIFGDGFAVTRRRRLRCSTAHAPALLVVGETAQLEFDLLHAADELIYDLFQALRRGTQTFGIDPLHLAEQVLNVTGNVARNFAIAAEQLLKLSEIASAFTQR